MRAWYFDHGPMVYRRCRALLRDDEEAQAAAQDVFAEVAPRREAIDPAAPTTGLWRVATTVCLQRARVRGRRPDADALDLFARIGDAPDREDRGLAARALDALLARAQVPTRELAVLHLVDGLTLDEVATETGLPVSAIRARVHALAARIGAPAPGSGPAARVADLVVERVFAGEGAPAERARVEADPDARARLGDLLRENARFHVRTDGEAFLRAVEARAGAPAPPAPPPRANWGPVVLVGIPVAVAALLLLRLPADSGPARPPGGEPPRAQRVAARLRLVQETPRGVERVSTDEVLFPGDEIRVLTVAGDATHGVVVSIDGRGTVDRLFPRAGGDTTLPPGQAPIGPAFALGDAPGFERFVFVTDDAPVDVEAVLAAARRVAAGTNPRKDPLPLPRGLEQSSFVIRMGER